MFVVVEEQVQVVNLKRQYLARQRQCHHRLRHHLDDQILLEMTAEILSTLNVLI